MTAVDNPMLDHALAYAARGWPVMPLHHPVGVGVCSCPLGAGCGKNAAKHPRTAHGLLDATTDIAQIRAWWTAWPAANIGLRTGVAFDALDVDAPDIHDGTTDWPELVDMPGGPVVTTGNGWHLYVLPTGQGNRTRFRGSCDWRGEGGYVIAPPSQHASGRQYRWHSPGELDLQPAPAGLLELLGRRPAPIASSTPTTTRSWVTGANSSHLPPERSWSPKGLIGQVAVAPEGTRNDTLVWAANRIGLDVHEHKAPSHDALDALDQLLVVAVRIGLSEHEAERTIRSGYIAGAAGQGQRRAS